MKKSLCIGIVLLLALTFAFSAIAAEPELVSPQHMPGYGDGDPVIIIRAIQTLC